jgi:transcriptional regulator with XRE-family HTH domain
MTSEKEKNQNTIGQRLRAVRDRLDITQAEVARRMGFVRNYISLVENGRKPSHRFVKALEMVEQTPDPQYPHFGSGPDGFGASPRGRIKARRKEKGLSLDDLAGLTGYQKSTLRNVEEGHTRASESLLRLLSTHLDLPLDELMGGSDHAHMKGAGHTMGADANIATGPGVTAQVIPLLSWAEAGTTEAWEDVYEHEGIVGFNVRDSKAVAVQIRGDSMAPQFPQGTIAIVYPTWEAKTGDLVIARLNDGTVMFKRLHVDGDHYTFISLNPIYPPLTVDKSKVEKLLPVGGTFQSQL